MDLESQSLAAADFPIGLFSDLHTDLESLDQLVSVNPEVKRWFCVGDFVDFRESKEAQSLTFERCSELGVLGVRGNHDFYDLIWELELTEQIKEYIYSLADGMILECPFGRIGLFHATPRSINEFCQAEDVSKFSDTFKQLELQTVFLGHIHRHYSVTLDGIRVINLGHLGKMKLGDPFRSYALLDSEGNVTLNKL